MGLLDKPKAVFEKAAEKAMELGETAKEKAKESVMNSIDAVPDGDLADLIMAAAAKQDKVNALLEERGSNARIGIATILMGPPPTVTLGIVRK